MSLRVQIEARDLLKKLDRLPRVARSATEREIHDAAVELRDESRLLAPKETHDLERSIRLLDESSSRDVITSEYGTDIEYGEFQEFGTEDDPGQPFIRPAVDGLGPTVARKAIDGIKVDIEGV